MSLSMLMTSCAGSCPTPKPPITVVERCMTAPENVPPLGNFPPQNADGTYTISAEYAQEISVFIIYLVDYVMVQYAACGKAG